MLEFLKVFGLAIFVGVFTIPVCLSVLMVSNVIFCLATFHRAQWVISSDFLLSVYFYIGAGGTLLLYFVISIFDKKVRE
jgi:hypothetical protein